MSAESGVRVVGLCVLLGCSSSPAWALESPDPDKGSVSAVEYWRQRGMEDVRRINEAVLRERLAHAVQVALQRSARIKAARADTEVAEAELDEAKGRRWPQLEVSGASRAASFGGSSGSSDKGLAAVQLSTSLYDWGQISNTISSREALLQANAHKLDGEQENIAFEVVGLLVERTKQQHIGVLSRAYADRMTELVEMLAKIVQVDPGRNSELTQARGRLLQAQAALDGALARERDAEIALQRLLGDTAISLPHPSAWSLGFANARALVASLERHPSIQQSRAESLSAEDYARAVRASGRPQVNWVVGKDTGENLQGDSNPWKTSIQVTWNAFSGGSSRAAERAALSRAEAGRQRTDDILDDLRQRIRAADHDARTMAERADLYQKLTLESDRIRSDFFDQWYHLGRRTLLDVLTAETDHYGNRVSEVNNRFDSYLATFRQYAAAGELVPFLRNGPS
ncbi:transporter [Metapseudomonas otitidis]|uniref:Transporter n=2 Tax=Metapseudomonas otitidis TaxID=319939 RepID=A0A679H091_9GAMM|nr:transporter [Pseudomonas otitidis]